MQGSEKQIAWAEKIKNDFNDTYKKLDEYKANTIEDNLYYNKLMDIKEAKVWIEMKERHLIQIDLNPKWIYDHLLRKKII